jgi:hypothetical protein
MGVLLPKDSCRHLSGSEGTFALLGTFVMSLFRILSFTKLPQNWHHLACRGTALREDMDMYKIFGYLTVFRADELGYSNLK